MDLVNQQHWDEEYRNQDFRKPSEDDILRITLLKYIPTTRKGKAFEVGCYPGGYLSVLGDLGYELNGIDLTPKTPELTRRLKKEGYRIGYIDIQDFMNFTSPDNYDVVMSFGFIEHFEDYREVILKHSELLKKNGYLVLSTPNYKGLVQYAFHLFFDTPGLRRHNIKSMKPLEWASMLKENGFEILFAGYGGGAAFWMNDDQTRIQHFLGRLFLFSHKWAGKLLNLNYASWNHPSIASDCILVAKKMH